ncbi:MAG: hypothetical protein NTY32_02775, partial [Bacteroidia bacterium]|nr:hypothetical protein [Bacteroidia bacterium]
MTGIKKRLATAICLLYGAFTFGQQPHYMLNSEASGSSKAYTAWDFISLKPGFHYASPSGSGNTFNATTQPGPPSLPTSNTYMTEEGIIVSDPAQGGVVGSLPGRVDVSRSGAATYSIPIECPAGMQGMTPSLSFSYNSSGGDGSMGFRWALNGLSSIYRSGSTLFKFKRPLNGTTWINDSIFYLDGNRLIAKNKVYPSMISGRTDIGFGYIPFVSVVGNNYTAECSAPRIFQVTNKDGSFSGYTAARDVVYVTDGKYINVEWLLAYTSDQKGNYIRYNYQTVGKQTVIKKIEYTGNSQKEPFDSIVFVYENKEITDSYYIADAALENRLLLKSIKAYSSNIVLRQYDLDYSMVGAKYFLQSIALKGLDNAHFRKSTFAWGPSYNTLAVQTMAIPDVNSNYPVSNSDRSWYAADMNGDGIDDIVNIYPTQMFQDGVLVNRDFAQVFTSTQTAGNITLVSDATYDIGSPTGEFSGTPEAKVLFGDINGDGKKEMLFPQVNTTTLTLTVNVKGIGSFSNNLGRAEPRPLFSVGDFNKDGKDDFVYMESAPRSDGKYYGGVFLFSQNTSGQWVSISQTTKPRRILNADLNNDGLNDILLVG